MSNPQRARRFPKRAQAATATRLQILAATRALLEADAYPNISIDAIAGAAGVSRQTIYAQFGSKSGVLQALAEHIEQAGLENLIVQALAPGSVAEALAVALGRIVAFYRQYADLLRRLEAQTVVDPAFASIQAAKRQEIWGNTRRFVERMEREVGLAAGWTPEEATDWLWALMSFTAYDQLVTERGWSPEQFMRRVLEAGNGLMRRPSPEPAAEAAPSGAPPA